MARARATRLRCPPLRLAGMCPAKLVRPTRAKHSIARPLMSAIDSLVRSISGNVTLSRAVIESNSAPPWNR